MRKPRIAVGQRYGRLVVIELRYATTPKQRTMRPLCRCDCGNLTEVLSQNLKRGYGGVKSCGCGRREMSEARRKPNRGRSEYRCWASMIQRCHNEKNPSYSRYGARGIHVCGEWRSPVDGFDKFFAHIGLRPSPRHSVDRIKNARGYESGNVRWALPGEQNRNTSSNRRITVGERTLVLEDWCKERDLNVATVHGRLKRGWSIERALEFEREPG